MIANLASFLASSGSALGRLLRELGLPEWALWVFLGLWITFWIVRRFTASS